MAAPNLLSITPATGKPYEVQTTLEDRLAFETALRKNKGWGKLEDNSLKLHPFLGWHAAKRQGKTDLSWEQFTTGDTAAISVDPVEPDEDDDDDDDLEVEGLGKDTQTAASITSRSYSPATTAAPLGNGAESPAHA